MRVSISNPFEIERINLLSQGDRVKYLELLCDISDGRKIPKIIVEGDFQYLIDVGIAKIEVDKEKYWSKDEWYLNKEDYDKLNAKYSELDIKEQLSNFVNWKSVSKNKRTSVYLTINKWCKTKEDVLTQEQQDFINNSYRAYSTSTNVTSSSKISYSKKLSYLLKKYDIEDLRSYLRLAIQKEGLVDDVKYRKKAENALNNFEEWIKTQRR